MASRALRKKCKNNPVSSRCACFWALCPLTVQTKTGLSTSKSNQHVCRPGQGQRRFHFEVGHMRTTFDTQNTKYEEPKPKTTNNSPSYPNLSKYSNFFVHFWSFPRTLLLFAGHSFAQISLMCICAWCFILSSTP